MSLVMLSQKLRYHIISGLNSLRISQPALLSHPIDGKRQFDGRWTSVPVGFGKAEGDLLTNGLNDGAIPYFTFKWYKTVCDYCYNF